MNAAEFLKLVEKYPLPWTSFQTVMWNHCDPESPRAGLGYSCATANVISPCPVVELADASPAMAKEIIKLLREVERAETGAVFDMEVAISGLRESLPESLR